MRLVAARLGDVEMALRYLRETAAIDLSPDADAAGGVHIAALGGLWQAVIAGFVGLNLMGDMLEIAPRLPTQWQSVSFQVHWQGRTVAIRLAGGRVQAGLVNGEAMQMRVAGVAHALAPGATLDVAM